MQWRFQNFDPNLFLFQPVECFLGLILMSLYGFLWICCWDSWLRTLFFYTSVFWLFVNFSFDELFINVQSVFLVNHQTIRTIFLFGRLLGDRRFIRRRVRIITYFIHGVKNKRRNLSLTSEREPKQFYGSWKSRVL